MSETNAALKAKSIVMVGLSLVTFLSLGYAVLQQNEAKKQSQVAAQLMKELELCKADNFVNQPRKN
jgi:hypothetical protein